MAECLSLDWTYSQGMFSANVLPSLFVRGSPECLFVLRILKPSPIEINVMMDTAMSMAMGAIRRVKRGMIVQREAKRECEQEKTKRSSPNWRSKWEVV